VVELTVDAEDQDGEVVGVEFWANGMQIGDVQSSPFTLIWTNTTPGTFSIRAQATDDSGWTSDYAVVTLTFVAPPPFFDASGSARLADGRFRLRASGVDGQGFRIDASVDLSNWVTIVTDQIVNGRFEFIDSDATNYQSRFYRILASP